ncbi:MAG: hypothetical protein HY735_24150 [Verrucomicrobia bacterium]|nr:hypothetical protein [Verrucomicrobiota bacterium]
MRNKLMSILALICLGVPIALGQTKPVAAPATPAPGGPPPTASAAPSTLTKFDLDFPGGTPGDLVRAIEKAMGKPLNAVVPQEYDRAPRDQSPPISLPPLKMKGVDVAQLFKALEQASPKTEMYRSGYQTGQDGGIQPIYQTYHSTYGFRTPGAIADDSIWYFYAEKAPRLEEQTSCRYWQLGPYLETYKIEDITTAIQTGWKMLGDSSVPVLNFHQDTKLLIGVGDTGKLQLVDSVLAELAKSGAKVMLGPPPIKRGPSRAPAKSAEKSADAPQT